MAPRTTRTLFHPGSVVRAEARQSGSPILYGYPAATTIFRGNGPLYETAARDSGLHVRGSGGAGVAYAALPAGAGVEAAQAALTRVRETCVRHGGSAVVVDAPTAVKTALDVWGTIPALDLMRRVKDQFDPDHRLAPGRFVGGI